LAALKASVTAQGQKLGAKLYPKNAQARAAAHDIKEATDSTKDVPVTTPIPTKSTKVHSEQPSAVATICVAIYTTLAFFALVAMVTLALTSLKPVAPAARNKAIGMAVGGLVASLLGVFLMFYVCRDVHNIAKSGEVSNYQDLPGFPGLTCVVLTVSAGLALGVLSYVRSPTKRTQLVPVVNVGAPVLEEDLEDTDD
jgi:hypothetical protein